MAFDLRASAVALMSVLGLDGAGDEDALSLPVSDPPVQASPLAVIPSEEAPRINLDAVWWTAPKTEKVSRLSDRWGIPVEVLRELNPELPAGKKAKVEAGQRILVYRHAEGELSKSIGAPNQGRLENGVPFPEGKYWALREYRPRAFATRTVVTNLATAFDGWGRRFPGAPPVRIGEFSSRKGGKAPPHSSHRSGRDVDVAYVLVVPETRRHKFTPTNFLNVDAEKTWGLVRAIVGTGSVDKIFVDKSIQRAMLPFAVQDLTMEELPQYFSVMADGARAQSKAKLVHWGGHDDHMHVRFSCSPADEQCSDNPVARKKKRRKKKRRRGKKKRRGKKRR
jgi:murein endopeptidase